MTNSEAPSYWIIVGSPENFAVTRQLGFSMQGIKSRHRKKAERMKPGDKMVYYLTGLKAFAAISTIQSPYVESHERIWSSGNPAKASEDYPFRVETKPEIVLEDGDYLDAEPLARQMEYAAKWPAANWTLAFQGNVHEIGEKDFRMIEDAMRRRGSAPVST